MNLKKAISLIVLSIFMLQTAAFAQDVQKIAIIDVQKIILASSQFKNFQKQQEAKSKEIQQFIKNAQADIEKQKTEESKQSAAEKYEKKLLEKQEAAMNEYKTKLKEIDNDITSQIGKQATSMGYTVVLPKSAVVYGGDDITDAVIKVIK